MSYIEISLLIVEDNDDDATLIARVLSNAGYKLRYERIETEVAFRKALKQETWDVILADYSLPTFSAIRALQIVHDLGIDTPFVVVTGTIPESEAVKLMHAGAHDYIIKGHWDRLSPIIARETRAQSVRIRERQTEADLRSALDSLRVTNDALASAPDELAAAFARALEKRDRETEGHSQRVTTMTVRLARLMGISDGELVYIRRGALLHDVGKIGIPDAILLKPGKLTAEEWLIMRQHPVYAYEMLSPIIYFRDSLDIPYYHHEKWDGSGYPRGLIGEAIPLAARVFAIADTFDALRRERPYKLALSLEDTLQEIESLSGISFDPVVVRYFLNSASVLIG
jgi:cyclic di-GMP phosphodiesterase